MIRKLWITSTVGRVSEQDIASAQAAGAGEIIQRPIPAALGELADGYHEIADADADDVPTSVTTAQARTALHRAGLLTAVEALMAAPQTDTEIKIFWEYQTSYSRTSPALGLMAGALGLTSGQVDELFRTAAQIAV